MTIYLYFLDGHLHWADLGTDKDIKVQIAYLEYERLKKMEIATYEYD